MEYVQQHVVPVAQGDRPVHVDEHDWLEAMAMLLALDDDYADDKAEFLAANSHAALDLVEDS